MFLCVLGSVVLAASAGGTRDFVEARSVVGGSPHLDSAFVEETESFDATSPSTKLAVQTGNDGSYVLTVEGVVWLSSSTPSLFVQGVEVRITLNLTESSHVSPSSNLVGLFS